MLTNTVDITVRIGREKTLIVISTVRANNEGKLGFLHGLLQYQLMNIKKKTQFSVCRLASCQRCNDTCKKRFENVQIIWQLSPHCQYRFIYRWKPCDVAKRNAFMGTLVAICPGTLIYITMAHPNLASLDPWTSICLQSQILNFYIFPLISINLQFSIHLLLIVVNA